MPTRRLLVAAGLAAALSFPGAILAQGPSDEDLEEFARIFIAVQENAYGLRTGSGEVSRRAAPAIIEEHDWTLERYSQVAHAVNTTPVLYAQFTDLLEEQGCAGLLQRPPVACR